MKLNVSKPRFLHAICLKSFPVLIVAAMTVAGFSATLRAEDPTYANSPRVVASATVTVAQASDAGKDVNYPLELLNRSIFDINGLVEVLFFRPAGTLYRVVLPQPVRGSVGNALNNLCSPIFLANGYLAGGARAGMANNAAVGHQLNAWSCRTVGCRSENGYSQT
jgi:ABC-type transporter lipoprotein component MlaA